MSYFSNYKSVDINLNRFDYEPIRIVLAAYKELKKTQSIDSLHAEINKFCRKTINRFVSGKKACNQDIEYIKELCRKKGTNTCRLLYRSIDFIDFDLVKYQVFESFYLNNDIEQVNILLESNEGWKYHEKVIFDLGLQEIFSPILKNDLKNKFFEMPILFFALPQWFESTLIIPPSDVLHFIYPKNLDYDIKIDSHLTLNSGKSLEIFSLENEINKTSFSIEPIPDFYNKFPKQNTRESDPKEKDELINSEFERDPVNILNILLTSNNNLFSNRVYLTIMRDNSLKFSSFDTESDLEDVRYIVSSIDASCANIQSLLKEQTKIMEVWKKPLRDNLKSPSLIQTLENLGAVKASEQNIKNWADSNRIAPRSESDFRAVLKFAGIDSEEQIKNYLYLAYKQRSDSISIGHKRSYLASEIVKRNIQERINKNQEIVGYFVSYGISFQVDEVKV
ncbi:hypothetical protein MHM87_15270 [Alteromonas sp. Cnat3-28]|jgi:hypothetical protein|uniref:hypothetical protein n=1 Tax=Alteromonas sp. Cnat3-28 TaxID=2917729 RepID=UPI001EF3E4D3|nr:hypothetical protein [Alteromonas sp. Cnat3-28]MCG7646943.1 hypothetical protein [Alteromonas sp. Cnat3-28]